MNMSRVIIKTHPENTNPLDILFSKGVYEYITYLIDTNLVSFTSLIFTKWLDTINFFNRLIYA